MAATDATQTPVKNQAYRITGCIKNVTTGKIITGGLSGLASTVSKDGGAFASTTSAAAEIGTTGFFTVDLSATEMNADTVAIKVVATNTNATDFAIVINPADLSLTTINAWDQSVKKLEQYLIQIHGMAVCEVETNATTVTLKLPVGAGTWLSGGIAVGPLAERGKMVAP